MISVNKLYLDDSSAADSLRYGAAASPHHGRPAGTKVHHRPIVVWNMTQRCNLFCRHCYSRSSRDSANDEMTTADAMAMIDDIAEFGVPVLLFSGGEPLMRPDLFELAAYAVHKGVRVVLSTNGTLLDERAVACLKDIGFSYVGVSLDGIGNTHDYFRACNGAYEKTLAGMRRCRDAAIPVGLRFTITRGNVGEIPAVFDLLAQEQFPRACFYHLAYSGRGEGISSADTTLEQKRQALDTILDRTVQLSEQENSCRVLTVGNHADGAYILLRMQRERTPRTEMAWELLRRNGGNSSGVGISCVSWDGTVYPDQFWRTHSLGNVKDAPFSKIWTDLSNPFLAKLKNKKDFVKGRCAACRFLDICGGNLRSRAEASCNDMWAPDPACYLTDEEVSQT